MTIKNIFLFFPFIISPLSLRESESLSSYNAHSLFPFRLKYNYFNLTSDGWENLSSRCFHNLCPNRWSVVAVKPCVNDEFSPIAINFVLQRFPKEKKLMKDKKRKINVFSVLMWFFNLVYTVLIIVIAYILNFSCFIKKNSKIILRLLKQNVVQAYISDVLLLVTYWELSRPTERPSNWTLYLQG